MPPVDTLLPLAGAILLGFVSGAISVIAILRRKAKSKMETMMDNFDPEDIDIGDLDDE